MFRSIACALVFAASLPAAAVAQPVVQSELVRFSDLNLTDSVGIETLDRRIQSAAKRVCGFNETRGQSHIRPKEYYDCLDNALASARREVAAKTGTTIRKG